MSRLAAAASIVAVDALALRQRHFERAVVDHLVETEGSLTTWCNRTARDVERFADSVRRTTKR